MTDRAEGGFATTMLLTAAGIVGRSAYVKQHGLKFCSIS